MSLEIREEPLSMLIEHAAIPIAFRIESVLNVTTADSGWSGIKLEERALDEPYVRDYDSIKGEGPTRWPGRFDTTNWALLAAYRNGGRVGGAVIAFKTAGLWMLGGREDLAALWDLRVRPEQRGTGVGAALFRATEAWARDRGCTRLQVETQNTTVAACG